MADSRSVAMGAACSHRMISILDFGYSGLFALIGAGGLAAVLGMSVLLLRRKLSAQQRMLAFQQERWQLLMSANQVGVFDLDVLENTVFYSPQWKAILGYAPNELVSRPEEWRKRLHPDDEPGVMEATTRYLQKGSGPLELEYRLRHRDGSWRWIVARSQAVWDSSGRAIRLVGSHSDITERKLVTDALRASEARFGAFMDSSPCLSFIRDRDGRLTYASSKFEQTWNLKPGEWLGRHRDELWPADLAVRFRLRDDAAFLSGVPQESIDEMLTPQGSRCFLTTVFAYPKAAGELALGGVSIDITERVRGEKALRASEVRHRQLFERTPLPCIVYSLADLRILDVNQAAVEHYGWSKDELLAMKFSDFAPPEDALDTELELRKCAGQNRATQPVRHRRKDQSEIWVELTGHEIEEPGVSAMLAMAQDITARVAAESEVKKTQEQLESLVAQRTSQLLESEAKWRGLVEALPQFVWSTGLDGEVDYFSHQWEEYTGIPNSELIGSGWLRTLHPADRDRIQEQRLKARSNHEVYDVEYRIRGKNGTYRWFVARGRPIRSADDGPITHWLGTSTDIEDQKRSEERLESAVRERTLDLAEARDRAECAAQAKSEFLAAMSHEIRTPMNAVIGMTSVLLSMPLTSEQRGYLDTIRSSGQALLAILNDILDFSKIEAGKMELETVEFDLQTILEESTELVQAAAMAKHLCISLEVDNTLPLSIVGDPGRLRQILLNLLSNAVKFTERGSILLSVWRAALQDQVLTLRFSVRDTGIGMSIEQQAGIFQAFTQADRSTTRRFGGTGLGLSIVKRLVELMGGSIGVSSQLGEGTTFWFNVCVAPGTEFENPVFSNQSVLLHDQNPHSRSTIKQYLERAGVAVMEAYPCPPHPSTFSVVLVDSMSLLDSTTIQSITSQNRPILVLGSDVDWKGSPAFPADKIFDFVPKPVRLVPLLRALQSALRGRHLGQVPKAPAQVLKSDLSGAQILLVEDNLVNQTIAKLLLERLGCIVDIARNGLEGCRALEKKSYDAIFMDCQMPEMDGFEATRFIRSSEKGRRQTPIIALTAGVLKHERDQCYAAGMDDFLSKPISQEDLKNTLEKWVIAPKVSSN